MDSSRRRWLLWFWAIFPAAALAIEFLWCQTHIQLTSVLIFLFWPATADPGEFIDVVCGCAPPIGVGKLGDGAVGVPGGACLSSVSCPLLEESSVTFLAVGVRGLVAIAASASASLRGVVESLSGFMYARGNESRGYSRKAISLVLFVCRQSVSCTEG